MLRDRAHRSMLSNAETVRNMSAGVKEAGIWIFDFSCYM